MLSVKQAEATILDLVEPLENTETIDLIDGNQRILATPVSSNLDFPYWDNSAMDGYAVRYEDVAHCPTKLAIVAEIPAGSQPHCTIQPGQAARIFTGAMLPPGADTIVMQENTTREGDEVTIVSSPQPGEFVRKKASFYQGGNNTLLKAGIALREPDIAVLATAGCSQLTVYRRPRVGIFSTGDELVTPDTPHTLLQPGQIIDSNQYALAAFVQHYGGVPIPMGIIPDKPEFLHATIERAVATTDLVLSTGGVSVGDYDYVDGVLAGLGGDIAVNSVAVKPGKPLTVCKFYRSLYFGIPGNPVSALVSCWRFVSPALRKLSGLSGDWLPKFVRGRSRQDLRAGGQRETYLWGKLDLAGGEIQFELAGGSHSSANLINLAGTNALAVVPVGRKLIPAGELVDIMLV